MSIGDTELRNNASELNHPDQGNHSLRCSQRREPSKLLVYPEISAGIVIQFAAVDKLLSRVKGQIYIL